MQLTNTAARAYHKLILSVGMDANSYCSLCERAFW